MRGFYMGEVFTGSPSDLQHISHDTNFTAKQWVDNMSASLATIESTSTASQPYTVGKRLVYGGRLYKVTQAIAQGGTLTPGTNITEDDVSSELDAINANLTANTFDTDVNIKSYNSLENAYICPSDGYVRLNLGGNLNQKGTVIVNDKMMLSFTTANDYPITSLFVRKGMSVYCSDFSESASITFFPLT